MNTLVFLLLVVIGLVAGVLSGLIGIGGAIIIIPALVYLLGMPQVMAQGTSLAVMLPPIGILAVLSYYKAGQINMRYAMIIALAFIVGGYLGSRVAVNISVVVLRRLFGWLLLLISFKMIFGK